jgi:hypothetical protein
VEAKLKHLEFIQGVINRMAGNSFLLKGWSVTLTSALFALAAKDANPLFVYLAYFPCATFWALDGYFLRQERLYRMLFAAAAASPSGDPGFSMSTALYDTTVHSWLGTTFSLTLRLFHGTVFAVIAAIMFFTLNLGSK